MNAHVHPAHLIPTEGRKSVRTAAEIRAEYLEAADARQPHAELAAVPEADRDYADWYEEGEAWVREWCAANKRRPVNDYGIAQLVHEWMRINCPAKLLAEHRAAVKAAIHAEFGAPGYRVGQYGLERVL